MKLNLLLVPVIAFASLSLSAKALVITEVNDETLFDTAVTDQIPDDFGANGSGYIQSYTTYPDTAGSFSDSQGYTYINNAAIGIGDGSNFLAADSSGTETFTASGDYSAVGANFFAVLPTANTLPLTVVATSTSDPSDTISHTFTLDIPGATGSPSDYFAGFLAPEGYDITSVSYPPIGGGNGPGIDNFTVGTVDYSVPIPEPASLGLMLIGSLFLFGWMRLRVRPS
jgi:hypothetical protein